MPMNNTQLAALVDKARQKPPPVIVTPPAPPVRTAASPRTSPTEVPTQRTRTTQPARTNAAGPSPPPQRQSKPQQPAAAVIRALPPTLIPRQDTVDVHAQLSTAAAESDDFPTGWELSKESWHFHRRFFRIFRRPMHRGEYSHLLWQIRHRRAEHLWEDCWRVTLPGGRRALAVRATRWRLITILPKNWQPPQAVAEAAD